MDIFGSANYSYICANTMKKRKKKKKLYITTLSDFESDREDENIKKYLALTTLVDGSAEGAGETPAGGENNYESKRDSDMDSAINL